MNYVSQSRTANPGAIAGALAIPAGVGLALALGLTFTVVITKSTDNPIAVPLDPFVPPPEPAPSPSDKSVDTTTSTISKPTTDTRLPVDTGPIVDTGPTISTGDDVTLTTGGSSIDGGLGTVDFGSVSLYDPIPASPKGNPGDWITNADYRTIWIAREMSGEAQFTLDIDARGRVTDCTITRSTGFDMLDNATCRLLSRRARFNAARDGNGDAVAGSYSSSVAWDIPE
jgi:protein TonB